MERKSVDDVINEAMRSSKYVKLHKAQELYISAGRVYDKFPDKELTPKKFITRLDFQYFTLISYLHKVCKPKSEWKYLEGPAYKK